MVERRLGDGGVLSYLRLLQFTALQRPDGDLSGMNEEAIEAAADYRGELGTLVSTLTDVRLLDGEPGSLQVHGWAEHNPWAASASIRSQRAKKSAQARWGNGDACTDNAHSMPQACDSHTNIRADYAPIPTPVPPPNPIPIPKEEEEERENAKEQECAVAQVLSDQFNEFYGLYPHKRGRAPAEKWWKTHRPNEAIRADIAQVLRRYGGLTHGEANSCCAADVWLKQKRWEDENPFPSVEVYRKESGRLANSASRLKDYTENGGTRTFNVETRPAQFKTLGDRS